MRIGRDHIASTVYTIAFATAGASLPVLLLIAIYNRPLFQVLQTEQFAAELIRTMVGSIGLILAVPLTTAIGVAVVRASRTARPARAPKSIGTTPVAGEPGAATAASAAESTEPTDRTGSAAATGGEAGPTGATAGATAAGTDDATTVRPKQTTRLRRRSKAKDDDYDFSDLRDPD
ncbi:MAG TPA: YibE/F family protein, partial [Microlunatus sp.]|nr:YibE/F family protein [Microlunatus sp.]